MKKIVFTGGGTVGHVTLNLLLIPRFLKDGWEVHYIGDRKGIEYRQLVQSGLDVQFHGIATGKLRRYFSWQNLLDVFKVVWGIGQSLAILLSIRPQALFSKGGFVSVPPVIASRVLGIPVFIHESDLSMGLANKIAYKFATTMYSTFGQSSELAKVKHVGAVTKVASANNVTPIQLPEILSQLDENLPTLLFVGGSGGAKVFNDLISQHQVALTERFNIINLTGDSSLNHLSPRLYRVDYVTDLYQPLMNEADVVITRGGSNTIFELVAMQKLHLIVPLGRKASRGDQLENARYFEEKGYAKQLDEDDLTFDTLVATVEHLLAEKEGYIENMAHSTEIQTLDHFYQLLKEDIERKA
ncbi:UDP-N-acetylglucosamine--N-acetylmuramyl-(pentapeptide) pyrophosphoryl-undecaprenol N-acetylglucosamine transferase [Streptococcus cuniculi]|uniref:UDP-N-acetylglucosamine--N-acetylmuramyl-(pentapeptide) pyrophosphoryl-undecaprenol N-acetylglucosamine transferase n=1 Tax=Streptococcus cuniculi TaxID=1432788 RepID=A0A4Y9JFI5_9STRE|nr:UDP-N-acetylglucosamine--N-acetylmuramyl-(pentapeptide) pyrophosphoryl-undecaprenol N-acetylglucosamine transferase [Streptococcus cuniculi]MBF0777177.1 UDP-N-acetylglucosamine--N-acetylmuramyl-(pentapeptide) pyrophosphoryl-undecaprenol N-acetylglucosamine transferase [Streptococcus cuniculi]TFU98786.1 UDP-N-acetylglucosamine--N-acetylmuramyl-(pentapeptide) pyrophosphoryl-undecaprenol N-acetylglucosamine transferase [Streptococcus cuniculi]